MPAFKPEVVAVVPKVVNHRREISMGDIFRMFLSENKKGQPLILFCPGITNRGEQESVNNTIHNALRKRFPNLGLSFKIFFYCPIVSEKVIVIKNRPKTGKLEFFEVSTSSVH
ncbi:MAG: hypothetical protein WCW46_01320 [Candidatus Paceibacterota bacterium]